ncbi:MAG: chaperone modulator CbpM [Paludibacteraceae bacterium]
MNDDKLLYSECLKIYDLDKSFVDSLSEFGLINIVFEQEQQYVECKELEYLEQFVRWHHDLDINVEGIEALHHMLQRIYSLQDEISQLRNELAFYKSGF